MSDYLGSAFHDRPGLRRTVVLLAVLLSLGSIGLGGSLLHAESAVPAAHRSAVVGRTSTVCTVAGADAPASTPAGPGETPSVTPLPGSTPSVAPTPSASPDPTVTATPSPTPSAGGDAPPSTVTAVAVRQGSSESGALTGSPLGPGEPTLTVTQPGTGQQLTDAKAPLVLTGEGSMATAGSGVVSSNATTGETTGLMAAPCLVPGTEHWLVGLGSTDADRTELILTNPDDAQAEVDLRFYGPKGRLVVPGSPGVVVGARETRTLLVSSLVDSPGPTAVAVRTSEGRVSVAARRLRTNDLKPAGADWQVPSGAPTTSSVIPGIPGGDGPRVLNVVNPGTQRATVRVEVLGLSGAFAPAGADTLEVAPESTATVELTAGLAGESGSVRLRSDQPVSGAVVTTSTRSGAVPDFAVQAAQPALVRQGVSAVATATGGVAGELVLSNGGDADAALTFEVLSYAGVSLRKDDLVLAAGSTATRRLSSTVPSYVVVSVPPDSTVVGSVTLTEPDGDVAGLATVPLTSPDVASRAARVRQDPAVGR